MHAERAGQLALLIFVVFIAAQVVRVWLFTDEQVAVLRATQRLETVERAAAAAQALDTTPSESRPKILAGVNSRLVRFSTSDAPLGAEGQPDLVKVLNPDDVRAEKISVSPHDAEMVTPPAALAWLHDRMRAAGVAPVEYRLSNPLPGGAWLNVSARFHRPVIQMPPAVVGVTLLSLALLIGALWVEIGRITRPLRQLADAANGFVIDAPAPAMPKGGPSEVRALRNLLKNARRCGGATRVSVGRTDQAAQVLIEDRDPGIPDSEPERVFDPFMRLETSRSRDTDGVRLGLPIARSILRARHAPLMTVGAPVAISVPV